MHGSPFLKMECMCGSKLYGQVLVILVLGSFYQGLHLGYPFWTHSQMAPSGDLGEIFGHDMRSAGGINLTSLAQSTCIIIKPRSA